MDDTETIEIQHVAPLQADDIPDANQSHQCFSCGEDISGVYCHACGNKNDNYRRSIWSLGAELFASLTAFEGRIWRSLRSLILKPGTMAREFADGARQKWTSPIRLFLATSLLLFGYIAISQTQLIAFGTQHNSNSVFKAGAAGQSFAPQIFFLKRKSKIKQIVTDKLISDFENNIENITDSDGNKILSDIEDDLGVDAEVIGGDGFELDSEGLRQVASVILRKPERLNGPINKYLSRIMFFMMPLSMLIGAIFIRGKERAMLYDHLVHAAYIHAFAFLLLFLFILLVQFTPIKGLIWIYTAILMIYLPLSAKRMFGRGWIKTLLTSYGVGSLYTFIMILILTALITLGFIDIAKDVAQSEN